MPSCCGLSLWALASLQFAPCCDLFFVRDAVSDCANHSTRWTVVPLMRLLGSLRTRLRRVEMRSHVAAAPGQRPDILRRRDLYISILLDP